MAKLNQFAFVEIFNEAKHAGNCELVIAGGLLPITKNEIVMSAVTGLFCADRDLLLIEFAAKAGSPVDGVEMDELPKASIETVRGVNVTKAVRELPDRADEWHAVIKDACAARWPRLNEDASIMAAAKALRDSGAEIRVI